MVVEVIENGTIIGTQRQTVAFKCREKTTVVDLIFKDKVDAETALQPIRPAPETTNPIATERPN
jgi:hypothetical protein